MHNLEKKPFAEICRDLFLMAKNIAHLELLSI